jgi:hypothetical protein
MSKLKLLFAATVAVVAFSAMVSSASAERAEIRNGGNIASGSLGKITFGNGPTIQCSLTLNGSLTTSATIVSGQQIGSITEVNINRSSCSGGEVSGVLSLPWAITLDGVPAGLPDNATAMRVKLRRTAFRLSTFFGFINCLYAETGSTSAGGSLALNDTGTNRYTTGLLTADAAVQLPLISGGEGCPEEGSFAGTFGLTAQQSITVS